MERSTINDALGRLSRAYGNRQFGRGEKDSYYEILKKLPPLTDAELGEWCDRITAVRRTFPSPVIMMQYARRPAAVGVRTNRERCRCGTCPGDGVATIYAPRWISFVQRGLSAPDGVHPTCAVRCSLGGFGKLASWRVGGSTIVAPCLPVPEDGRIAPRDEHEKYVLDWLRAHDVSGTRVTEFDAWNAK